jgi:hypothetical protein
MSFPIAPYWLSIVEYYYGGTPGCARDITIWKMLEEDYYAKRSLHRYKGDTHRNYLTIDEPEDLVAFKLKFAEQRCDLNI